MTSENDLDQFGRILMRAVRDRTITDWDKIEDGTLRGRTAERVRELIAEASPDVAGVVHELIPRIVDRTLFWLLQTLDESPDLCLYFRDRTQIRELRDQSDGLAGELFTEEGWIRRFSRQRYTEDL